MTPIGIAARQDWRRDGEHGVRGIPFPEPRARRPVVRLETGAAEYYRSLRRGSGKWRLAARFRWAG
jgi:hypothetical protein